MRRHITWHIRSIFSSVGITKYTAGTSGIGSRSECKSLENIKNIKITDPKISVLKTHVHKLKHNGQSSKTSF